MSDDSKRFVAVMGAIVITTLAFIHTAVPWWVFTGFMLLVMMALHAVLGVSAIWYNGEDAWEKAHTVSMWLLVAAGLLGTWLFIPDASVVARIVVVVVCVGIGLIFGTLLDKIRWG